MGVLDLMGHVQKQSELGRERGQQTRLGMLAGQSYGATTEQRPEILSQMARINPAMAQQQQTQFQGQDDRTATKAAAAAQYVLNAQKTGDPNAVRGAYMTVRPFLEEIGRAQGKVPPPEWSDDMLPMLHQVVSAGGGAGQQGGGVQSTYIDGEGNRVAIMRDGSQKVLGANDTGMSQQSISIPGADGRPRQYTFDKRTGNYIPAGEGGQSSALGAPPPPPGTGGNPLPQGGTAQIVDAIAEQANRMIASGVPEAQVEAWARSQQGAQPVGAPAPQAAPAGPSAFVGRSPEEEAAAVARAKGGVELDNLPQELRLRTEAGIQEATGKAQAEARVKREADLASASQKKYVDASTTLSLLDEVEGLLGKSTGSRGGALMDDVAAWTGRSTEGAQAIAALQPLAASLTLAVPRMEGPQSDADRMLYQKAAGDFANPNIPRETRLAALKQMRRLANKYVSGGGSIANGGQAKPTPSAGARRARNPQTGAVVVLVNGQWVPE